MRNQRNQSELGRNTLGSLLGRGLAHAETEHQEIALRLMAARVAFELSDRIQRAPDQAALVAELDQFLSTEGV